VAPSCLGQRARAMSLHPDAIKGLFAVAGASTIANGEAWIGPMFPPTFVFKGAAAFGIGALAIKLGLILLLAK